MRLVSLVLVALLASAGLTACSRANALPEDQKLQVVATAFPLYEAVASVGGKRVHARNLLPLDPFGPLTGAAADQLKNADLAIVLGKGTQPAVDVALAQRTKPTIVVLDDFATELLPGTNDVDPYVWLNAANMVRIYERVRLELIKADADGAPMYERYAKNLEADVTALDRSIIKVTSKCERRDLVIRDNRFGYFARKYGLNQVVVRTDGDLDTAIARYEPSTIYRPTLPSIEVARALLDRYDVRVSVLDPLVVQTDQARRGGASYRNVMNLDVDAIEAGLDCTASG